MAEEQLRIAGLTGVELKLDIAGPGSRSYAFVIDWHIRFILAIAWFFAGIAVLWYLGVPRPWVPTAHVSARNFFFWFSLPPLLIYFLYHPVLEVAMRGHTPGKRMAGVRIVTRAGGTPGTGALLIRNLLRIVDCLPTFYVVGLLCCFLSEQRVRIGDLAAGTLLVLDSREAASALARIGSGVAQSGLAPSTVELIQDLLERWRQLEQRQRMDLARTVILRVDAHASAAALEPLQDEQLRERLQALLQTRSQA